MPKPYPEEFREDVARVARNLGPGKLPPRRLRRIVDPTYTELRIRLHLVLSRTVDSPSPLVASRQPRSLTGPRSKAAPVCPRRIGGV
ncbi:hypothetical protein GCM10011579_034800 [Streptomyces albiflavescens]|uniref:Uncharacterized protein n=1 Tax=Streptomyces albiflavescens TaxID=1623582 RepID=A0A917Y4L0_9ACTN|nr:hypothetical protein GCM10011579_034800 [Streptomyces albiflavescens]